MLRFLRKRANEIYTAEHIAKITLEAAIEGWSGVLAHAQTLPGRLALVEAITMQVFIRIGDSEKLTSLFDRYMQKRDEMLAIQRIQVPHPDEIAEMLPLASQIVEAVSVDEQTECARVVFEAISGQSAPREMSQVLPIIFSIGALPVTVAKIVRGYDEL